MFIIDHKHIKGTERKENQIVIPELDRYKSSVQQFIRLANLDITLTKPTAFLYVDGFSTSQAESGINTPSTKKYVPAIKSGSSYIMHEWIYTFKGKEHLQHANVISSTCAAGIQALYEAEKLLNGTDIQEVIIIGGERITDDTLRLFRELNIPLICGDGFVYMKLGRDNLQMDSYIQDIKWKYSWQKNPFYFPREVIDTLIPDYPVDYVKLHGTGTESNTAAEAGLAQIAKPIVYKPLIGHCQGISSLIETSILLDDTEISGRILVVANGLGGFYGAFTLLK